MLFLKKGSTCFGWHKAMWKQRQYNQKLWEEGKLVMIHWSGLRTWKGPKLRCVSWWLMSEDGKERERVLGRDRRETGKERHQTSRSTPESESGHAEILGEWRVWSGHCSRLVPKPIFLSVTSTVWLDVGRIFRTLIKKLISELTWKPRDKFFEVFYRIISTCGYCSTYG